MNAQLPSDSLLFASLDSFYTEKLNADLAEFQVKEKFAWLKYLPSVGIGYALGTDDQGNLKNILRPSLSLSSGLIIRAIEGKQTKKAKIKSLKASNKLELEEEKRALEKLLRMYQAAIEDCIFFETILGIDRTLFEKDKKLHDEKSIEMPTSKFLPLKKSYLIQLEKNRNYSKKKKELEFEIIRMSRI